MPVYRMMDHVLAEELDGEVLAIDERTGVYYSMGGSAASIWSALTTGVSVETLFPELSSPVGADLSAFITQLCEVELLAAVPEAEGEELSAEMSLAMSQLAGDWKAPVLGVHDEMQEILLFDPIHQVDYEQGWPHRGEEAAS